MNAGVDRIRKAFALALHPNTDQAERQAAWIGALRLCLAQGFKTLDAVVAAAGDPEPDGWEVVMPFGKHKGCTLGEIARSYPDYMDWLIGQRFRSERLNDAIDSVYEWMEKEAHGTH